MHRFIPSSLLQSISLSIKAPLFLLILYGPLVALLTLYLVKTYPHLFGPFLSPSQCPVQPAILSETQQLIEQVSKLISLPQDETPTVATVTDLEKAQTQSFFKNAKIGDKVLVYQNAKKAILYRPSEQRIIDIANVKIQEQVSQTTTYEVEKPPSTQTEPPITPSPTPSIQEKLNQPLKIAVYNSTIVNGLAKAYATQLKQKFPQTIIQTGNSINDYPQTILIDLTGSQKSLADSYAQVLGITTASLPQQEPPPPTDFLIILGQDQVSLKPSPLPSISD